MARLNNCRFNATAGGTTDWTYSSVVAGYNDPVTAGAVTATPYEYFAISASGADFEGGKGVCTITGGVPTFARTTVLFNSLGTTAKINFSAAPQVAIVVYKDDMLSFDEANSFTAAQQAQAQTNLGLDTARQNALLTLAYQSKMYGLAGIGGYRREINVVADGFTTATGINVGSSSNYQMDNISGILGPLLNLPGSNLSTSGNAIAGPAAAGVGTIAGTADGSTTGTNGWGSGETSGGVSGVSYVGQNFGTPRHIRQLILNQGFNGDTTYCCTSAIVQFSDDGSTWVNHSTITLAVTLSAQTFALAASGLHQYWRIRANSAPGAANRWGVMELQMMEYTVPSNMVAITTAQTADASVSNCRALIEFDNTASPTLGTDLTIELTCNGGTNWTAAVSYTVATSNSQGSRKVIETNDVACTSGTSFAARIKTFNSKNAPIYALAVAVH